MKGPLSQPVDGWPVIGEYDVVVIGAGPSGIGAAISAARLGAKTLVVERYGFPGGTATIACVPCFWECGQEGRQVSGGIADEFVRELGRVGEPSFMKAPEQVPDFQKIGDRPLTRNVITTAEDIRLAANRMLRREGVDLLYYTATIGAVVEGRRILAAAVDRLEGPALARSKCFVDASGDANLVHRAGGEVRHYSAEESMAKSLFFRLGGVENFNTVEASAVFKRLRAEDRLPALLRSQDVFGGLGLLHPGEVLINVTLARGDGTASADMTRMGMEMQEQMYAAVEMLRKEAPGFAKCYLIDSGAGVGVRAGRGIVGHETITRADIDNNTSVPEPVAISKRSYGTHYTKGFRPPWAKSQRGLRPLPWKALIPVSFDNVMVGGRAISAEPHVMDTFRLMHTCMATGMAAGITAALAAKTGKDSLSVGYAPVRAELLKRGAILE